jgi:ABC-type Zn uptake system ZnuABC Zn-binding protein ZnuA
LQAAQVDPLLRKNGERDFDASRNASLLAPPEGGPRLGENHPSSNPHFLLDPRNGIRVAEALEKALSQVDPTHSAGYVERFRQFQKKREAQLQAWQSRLKSWSGKVAVTDHAHLTYLWAWLGVSAQATLELAPGHPPTPAHLEKLVQEMKKRQVKVFFFESGRPESLVRVIARRTQAKALGIDPSGRESQWEPLIEALAKAP